MSVTVIGESDREKKDRPIKSEGLGPIGWLLHGWTAATKDAGEAVLEWGAEEILDLLGDLFGHTGGDDFSKPLDAGTSIGANGEISMNESGEDEDLHDTHDESDSDLQDTTNESEDEDWQDTHDEDDSDSEDDPDGPWDWATPQPDGDGPMGPASLVAGISRAQVGAFIDAVAPVVMRLGRKRYMEQINAAIARDSLAMKRLRSQQGARWQREVLGAHLAACRRLRADLRTGGKAELRREDRELEVAVTQIFRGVAPVRRQARRS